MWLLPSKYDVLQITFLDSIGRALTLAHHYEAVTKSILGWFLLSMKVKDKQLNTADDMVNFLNGFKTPMLGGTIKDLGMNFSISKDDIDNLNRAKNARNYIAHEATTPIWASSNSAKFIKAEFAVYLEHVKALAKGDNIVSGWHYMFEEKEPLLPGLTNEYEQEIISWVLEPLSKNGLMKMLEQKKYSNRTMKKSLSGGRNG